jgi:hypothetical protein
VILRRRSAAHDPRWAALDVVAAARFLAGVGIAPARLWVERIRGEADPRRRATVDAWSLGIAVVPTASREAQEAAIETASAIGASVLDARAVAGPGGSGSLDGKRLAARYALGLNPDDAVELVLGKAATIDLDTRLADFDARAADDPPVRRRLILADLPDSGPQLAPAMISAIVHPLVLVDLRRSEPGLISLARAAADEVAGPA